MKTICIVDDEPVARRLLYHAIKSEYAVHEAPDGAAALDIVKRERVDLVLLDLHLPPHTEGADEGVRVHEAIRTIAPGLPIVITTGDQDHDLALDMVRRGVADFLLKPVDPAVLRIVIARALERAELERELDVLREQVRDRYAFGSLIGRSAAMREIFGRLERLARSTTTVLLLGESGTGKSALAKALHYAGPRSRGPFVTVDGATLPESLLESELFGHVRGAYTGADAARPGRIRAADGGTLFLDELGNLSLTAQAKLLLFLDSRCYTPVGSNEEVRADARLVAATNRDLGRMVSAGTFREDLFYRLQVATVALPPLRDRREDIGLLAEYLLESLAREMDHPGARLTPAALRSLEESPWPGNVRQLRHALESALVMAGGETLDVEDLALSPETPHSGVREAGAAATGLPGEQSGDVVPRDDREVGGAESSVVVGSIRESVAVYEKELLRKALARAHGNKAAAGRLLGLDENAVRYLCRKHRLG